MPEPAVAAQSYTEEMSRNRRRDLWGLHDLDSFDAEAFDIKIAHEMLRKDASIAAAWGIIRLVLSKSFGEYQHDDPEIQEFVQEALKSAEGYDDAVQAILTAPAYGFSCVEAVWEAVEAREWTGQLTPQWTYRKLKPVHPLTIRNGFKLDDMGNLEAVEQRIQGLDPIELPREKLILWSFNDVWGDRPEGYSMLEPAYGHYHACKALRRLWHRALEQGPKPLITWPVPPGEMYCPIHQKQEPRVQVFTELLEDIDDRSGIAYVAQGEDWADMKPTVLANEHIKPGDFLEAIRYHEGNEFKALLTPRMLFEEPEHATRAQAQVQFYGPFVQNIEGLHSGLERVLIEQLVKPLIVVNFPPGRVGDYGSWEFSRIQAEEYEMWAGVIWRLVNAGLRLTDADWAKIRSYYGDLLVTEETEELDEEQDRTSDEGEATEQLAALGRYDAELRMGA